MPLVTSAGLVGKEYDVIVVGSGAAGGQTAYTLAMDGAKVLMLEAGRNYVPEQETPMFQTRGDAPLHGTSTPEKPFGFYDATVDGGWQVPGEPYVNTSQDESGRFDWWCSRMLGGRTNHWGRYSFRNGPYDFKPHARDGLGFDWPLSHEELAPYYDKVEMLIGVCQRIVNGTQAMTIYKPLRILARNAADLAVRMAQRKVVVAPQSVNNGAIDVPSVLADVVTVTKDNMLETVIADGLHSFDDVYRGVPEKLRPAREGLAGR